MSRKRKPGPRTKSGRLSKAHKKNPELRDMGTDEARAKRLALVGQNGDETLAATASGMLYAHGYLEREEYDEALEYRRLYAMQFGMPWPNATPGNELSEDYMLRIKERFEAKAALLTEEQESVVRDVCVFDQRPNWFFAARLGLKTLPEDETEKQLLVSGLKALVHGAKRGIKNRIDARRRTMISAEMFTCRGSP